MYLKRGTVARFSLVDGSAFSGRVKFSWRIRAWVITDVVVHTPHNGDAPVDGYLILPKRTVLLVQVVG